MPLDTIVRKAVAIADKVTSSLQPVVTIYPWTGQAANGRGTPTFATAVPAHAIVEFGGSITDTQGREVQTLAHVTFPRPLTPNGSPGRQEPIDPRDRIVLMNGETGPIVKISGFADPSISRP